MVTIVENKKICQFSNGGVNSMGEPAMGEGVEENVSQSLNSAPWNTEGNGHVDLKNTWIQGRKLSLRWCVGGIFAHTCACVCTSVSFFVKFLCKSIKLFQIKCCN